MKRAKPLFGEVFPDADDKPAKKSKPKKGPKSKSFPKLKKPRY